LKPEDVPEDQIGRHVVANRTPEYAVESTDYGLIYGAYREAEPGKTYWRIAQYMLPFWTMPPTGPFGDNIHTRAWVPMDDTHTMFVAMIWTRNGRSLGPRKDGTPVPGHVTGIEHRPNTTDWYGRWRHVHDARDDYGQDRDMQRTESYSGITGIHLQDQAITESMGEITDFAFERLAPSDVMVTRMRRLLLTLLDTHKKGTTPPCVDDANRLLGLRGGEFLAPSGLDLTGAYRHQLRAATDPTGTLQAAE
jgi:hypothetical protein